jgi:hypothetical protein
MFIVTSKLKDLSYVRSEPLAPDVGKRSGKARCYKHLAPNGAFVFSRSASASVLKVLVAYMVSEASEASNATVSLVRHGTPRIKWHG